MGKLLFSVIFALIAYPVTIFGITTIHHDKPEEARISEMATKMRQIHRTSVPLNTTRIHAERQKRLLPYINYYLDNNYQKPINYQIVNQSKKPKIQQEQDSKFTPFLESNALPGPFIPITKYPVKNEDPEYVSNPPVQTVQTERVPNYSGIYEKLAQLKLVQQINKPSYSQSYTPTYRRPQIKYVPVQHYQQEQYKSIQPAKTVIETYTPTNIDITEDKDYESQRVPIKNNNNNENLVYKIYNHKPQYVEIATPQQHYRYNDLPITSPKPYLVQKGGLRNPVVYTIRTKPAHKQVNTIIDDKYVAQKFIPQENLHVKPVQFVPEQYEAQDYYQTPTPSPIIAAQHIPTENSNSLQHILKQLQESNSLPQTLTAENIDNSIKTLVKILNTLKKQQKLISNPIVVAEEENPVEIDHSEEIQEAEQPQHPPGTVTQSFPADTVEGGTPGRPGIDYPALSSIPPTTFNCKTQRYKGFFGDPNTNCQVWHYCDLNGGQASFLCPNGTIFSQVALTCDWWYNVKCSSTTQLYVLNERLYKYILPLSPKFPEDYSGPLVDKYIALKFKEMEEKMEKEKKKEESSEEEKDDSDQLQDIQNEKNAKSSEET